MVEATAFRYLLPLDPDVARHMILDRPAIDADRIREAGATQDVFLSQNIISHDATRLANTELRCDIYDVGFAECRHIRTKKLEDFRDLTPSLDLAMRQLNSIGAIDSAAVGVCHLSDIHSPFDIVSLWTDDRRLAWHVTASDALNLCHDRGNRLPSPLRRRSTIYVVDTKHHGRVHHAAGSVAELVGRTRPGREISVARSINEYPPKYCSTARFRFDQQRTDFPIALHLHARCQCVKQ